MHKVIMVSTVLASLCYVFAGFFGYATFVERNDVDKIMNSQNIFTGPYHGSAYIEASMFVMSIGVVLSTPLSVLPCKDAIEELILGQTRIFSDLEDACVTVLVITACCMFALVLPNIGDALVVVGATTNPVIGFILPCAFWLKIDKRPKDHPKRILAILVTVVVTALSICSLWFFTKAKLHEADEIDV
jgi:amino acid permease